MTTHQDPLRRVAILVATLDTVSADRLLDELPPDDAARVRSMMVELSHLDADEEQAVIGDFLRSGFTAAGLAPAETPGEGVELCLSEPLSPHTASADDVTFSTCPADGSSSPDEPSFDFLHDAECDRLLQVLSAERPQTIALVVSRLPEARALQVLGALPDALQSDVLRRWIDLDETDPAVLREVEQELQARIVECFGPYRRRATGLVQVASAVGAADAALKQQILNNLAKVDPALAEQITEPRLDFADIEYFDDVALNALLPAADFPTLSCALAGATESLVERIMCQLPGAKAKELRRAIDSLAPVRLTDIEAAQGTIARVAERIMHGCDVSVSSRPLSAAG